jgi:hypothetical protein
MTCVAHCSGSAYAVDSELELIRATLHTPNPASSSAAAHHLEEGKGQVSAGPGTSLFAALLQPKGGCALQCDG